MFIPACFALEIRSVSGLGIVGEAVVATVSPTRRNRTRLAPLLAVDGFLGARERYGANGDWGGETFVCAVWSGTPGSVRDGREEMCLLHSRDPDKQPLDPFGLDALLLPAGKKDENPRGKEVSTMNKKVEEEV
ncbi:hypothetical protein KSP39_PZI000861 [Platanthera zijinensis]|uniref:Uncharacterized protein n=1 Tax=Platanthera zijinensis TaxID=2320716 RepID=A0AAP0GFN6_9ASPA